MTRVRDALSMFASVRDRTGMLALVEVAYALGESGDVADGLRPAGAAAAYERRHGGEYRANVRDLAARPDPKALTQDDPALAAAWAEGEGLNLDEAVELALSLLDAERRRGAP